MTRHKALIQMIFILALILAGVSCSRAPSRPAPETPEITQEAAHPTATAESKPENTPTPVVVALPTGLIREPVPDTANQMVRLLTEAEHQPNDYYQLAKQLQGIDPATLTVQPIGDYKVNDRMDFYIIENPNNPLNKYKKQPSRLRYISDHAAWWAGIDVTVDDTDIEALANRFEDQVFPINQQLFGKEWSPGIDGDKRIHILLIYEELLWGGVFGIFSPSNEYPKAIFPYSNEREMFIINIAASRVDSEQTATELAHEYQHLIHWNQDPNEDHWFNESMGELVTQAGGSVFGESNELWFAQNHQIQLTTRPERNLGDEDKSSFAHYAAERQFSIYLLEQFGSQFINSLVHNPDPGVFAIQEELAQLDGAPDFKDVFANWLLANFFDNPELMDGQFGYTSIDTIDPSDPRWDVHLINSTGDGTFEGYLPPYGAHYYQLNSTTPIKLTFNGSTLTRLTAKDPAEGNYVWYSNRGDETTFSLTRSFDLSGVDKATLNYKVWYELEDKLDYAYVEISTDGENWTILPTAHGTDQNPYLRAYGIGYTGSSVDWLDESIDLSDYTGQPVQIRFEVISDFTVDRDGLQLDNIEIPEIGFFDGAEDDQGGWEAQGFIRSTNLVPVDWIVWVVTYGPNIQRVELSPEQSGTYELSGFGKDYDFALLVIAPTAPVSTLDIDYEFVLEH